MRRCRVRFRYVSTVAACFAVVGTAACGGSSANASQSIRVAAPASMARVMQLLVRSFEAGRDIDVETTVGGSSLLARQVIGGAPVDVLLTADGASMDIARRARAVEEPVPVASNRAVVVVSDDARVPISATRDLARPGLVVVVCAPQAACGAVAERVLEQAGVDAENFAREPDVNAVMTRVRLGEADAGVAYATDARGAGGLRVVDVSPAVTTTYFAAVVRERPQRSRSASIAWLAFLRSEPARAVLARAGFGRP